MFIFEARGELRQLEPEQVRVRLRQTGIVLFRGFDVDLQAFEEFTEKFSAQRILSMGGEKTGGLGGSPIQLILPHGYGQALHQENGPVITRPELLWFYCHTPARAAGQTTYADGTRIWELLCDSTRDLFLERNIKYSHKLERAHWLTQEGYLDMHVHVGKLRMAGLTVRFDEDDRMIYEYVTSAITRTRWGGEPAFVNSLRGPYTSSATFANDDPIPDPVIDEIDGVHERVVQEIPWQSGDIALIDNTRCVHGRRRFDDRDRKVYTLMSLANF